MISSFNLAMLSPRLAPAGGSSPSFMRCSRRDSRPPEALLFNLCAVLDTCSSLSIYALLSPRLAPVADSSLSIYALLVAYRPLFAFRCSPGCIPAALPRLAPAAGSFSSFNSLPEKSRTSLAALSRIAGWDSLCRGFALSSLSRVAIAPTPAFRVNDMPYAAAALPQACTNPHSPTPSDHRKLNTLALALPAQIALQTSPGQLTRVDTRRSHPRLHSGLTTWHMQLLLSPSCARIRRC